MLANAEKVEAPQETVETVVVEKSEADNQTGSSTDKKSPVTTTRTPEQQLERAKKAKRLRQLQELQQKPGPKQPRNRTKPRKTKSRSATNCIFPNPRKYISFTSRRNTDIINASDAGRRWLPMGGVPDFHSVGAKLARQRQKASYGFAKLVNLHKHE